MKSRKPETDGHMMVFGEPGQERLVCVWCVCICELCVFLFVNTFLVCVFCVCVCVCFVCVVYGFLCVYMYVFCMFICHMLCVWCLCMCVCVCMNSQLRFQKHIIKQNKTKKILELQRLNSETHTDIHIIKHLFTLTIATKKIK